MYNNFSFLINLISCNAASSCPLYVYLHPISNATFTSFQSFNTRNPSTILHLFFNTPPTIALLFSFRFNLPFNFANNCFVVNRSPRINATISSSVIRKSSGEGDFLITEDEIVALIRGERLTTNQRNNLILRNKKIVRRGRSRRF